MGRGAGRGRGMAMPGKVMRGRGGK